MRRIAFMNQKGGVGKTTTVANLGAALVELGHPVLAVDIDPQANLTAHLDNRLDDDGPTVYEVITGRATAKEAIVETSTPGFFLLRSSLDLSGAEIELVREMGRETILREALEEHFREMDPDRLYEFLLIDCPPSLGLLSLNALTTATEVMIPIQTQFFALRGMSKLMEVVRLVKRRLRPELEVTAIIPAIADMRTRLTAEVLSEIRKFFGEKVTRTVVRSNVRLAEAPSYGKTILQYDSSARGARDYRELALELTGRLPEEAPLPPDPEEEPPIEERSEAGLPVVVEEGTVTDFEDLPAPLRPEGEQE